MVSPFSWQLGPFPRQGRLGNDGALPRLQGSEITRDGSAAAPNCTSVGQGPSLWSTANAPVLLGFQQHLSSCTSYPGCPSVTVARFSSVNSFWSVVKRNRFSIFVQIHHVVLCLMMQRSLLRVWQDVDTSNYLEKVTKISHLNQTK